jgi:hypothetical protein
MIQINYPHSPPTARIDQNLKNRYLDKPAKMYYLLRKGIKGYNLVISIFFAYDYYPSLGIAIILNRFTMQFAYS